MVKLVFNTYDGERSEVAAVPGSSVMEVATGAGVDAILGDCGGNLSCCTCHCYVSDDWAGRVPAPDAGELAMLDGVLERQPNSRLSCQIRVTEEIDGIELHLPERQF
jgi:2Fe-2S ferredoxin